MLPYQNYNLLITKSIIFTMLKTEQKSIKTIRIADDTYQKLINYGKYSETMDQIVNNVLKKAEGLK